MHTVKFRKKVAFIQLLGTSGFVYASLSLIYMGLFWDASMGRKISSVMIGVFGVIFFGMAFFRVLTFMLYRETTLFQYDAEKIYAEGKEIAWKDIKEMTEEFGFKAYYVLHCENDREVKIPKNGLTNKENREIVENLNRMIEQGRNPSSKAVRE